MNNKRHISVNALCNNCFYNFQYIIIFSYHGHRKKLYHLMTKCASKVTKITIFEYFSFTNSNILKGNSDTPLFTFIFFLEKNYKYIIQVFKRF